MLGYVCIGKSFSAFTTIATGKSRLYASGAK